MQTISKTQQSTTASDGHKSLNESSTFNKTFSANGKPVFEIPQHYEKPKAKHKNGISNKTPDRFKFSRKTVLNLKTCSKPQLLPNGITSVDPQYFKTIQTRAKRKSDLFHRNSYINDLNENLRENIMAGFRNEEIYRIDELQKHERESVRRIEKKFHNEKHKFEIFIDNDHTETMYLMAQANAEGKKTAELKKTYARKQKELGVIQNSVFNLEETYYKYKRCTAFIMSITPKQYKRISFEVVDTDRKSLDTLDSVECDIEYEKTQKPKLYFTEPSQIFELIKELELQNIKLMDQTIHLELTIKTENTFLDYLVAYFNHEIFILTSKIKKVDETIKNLKNRTTYLEKLFKKLMRNELRDNIAGHDTVLIHMYIQKTHSLLFKYPIGTETTCDMLMAIQIEYRQLIAQVDNISASEFFPMLKAVQKAEKHKYETAKIAKRTLVGLDKFRERILNLLDEPYVLSRRKLMVRSFVSPIYKQKSKVKEEFTEEALLDKHLFTETCVPQTKLISVISTMNVFQ